MTEQTTPPATEQQRLLTHWNACRFAQAALQRNIRRSTERLLRQPATPPTS